MSVQVSLLSEATLTLDALERLLAVVDIADMPLQIARDRERAFTVLAAVGLFARVRSQVAGQVRRPGKGLVAESAHVLVLCQRSGSGGGGDLWLSWR